MRPPRVPDDRASADLNEDFGQMGFRVPAVAISPYARRAKKRGAGSATAGGFNGFDVDHGQYGHESILKLIRYRFGLGDLNTRMKYAQQHRAQLRLASARTSSARSCPTRPRSSPQPCALGGGDVLDSQEAHASDLADTRGARRALQAARATRASRTTSSRMPDTIKKGIAAAPS